MRPITIGVLMLVIFAVVGNEARIALEITLSVAFTLGLFISILLGMKIDVNKSKEETEDAKASGDESPQEQIVPNIPQEEAAQGA